MTNAAPPASDSFTPWHFLYFFPLPHGHGSLRPTFGPARTTGVCGALAGATQPESQMFASQAAAALLPQSLLSFACTPPSALL
jgi:hypothetical protein